MSRVDVGASTRPGVEPGPAGDEPQILDGPAETANRRFDPATLLAVGGVALAFLVPLYGLFRTQGPPMEEGFMLVFPERVLHGDLPNRDFLHLYGPGSLWVLAGVFKVLGVSVFAERLVGLAQQVALVGAIFVAARQWGRGIALGAGLIAVLIIVPPIGLVALAWVGGVALGLWAVVSALWGRHADDLARARRHYFVAGLFAGFALLYRLDLVLALTLGLAVVLWTATREQRVALAKGAALGVAPYLIHLATAGPGTVIRGMILDPVVYLRGGRTLPIPPSPDHWDGWLQRLAPLHVLDWPLPAPFSPAQLTIWFILLPLVVGWLVFTGWRQLRRAPGDRRGRTLLAVAAFSVGLLPQAIQRADSTHLAWVSCVPFAMVPAALALSLERHAHRLASGARQAVAALVPLVLLLALVPHFTYRNYTDLVVQTFGYHRLAFDITHDGRTFIYGRHDVAQAVPALLDDVDKYSDPGDRLFVGTGDLRKTPYSDAYLYYLFPHLVPATYYIEMDPGVANAEGSRLADDLASADVVILSTLWDNWDEPNDSLEVGSDAASQVLKDNFCQVGTYGAALYYLYIPCDRLPSSG